MSLPHKLLLAATLALIAAGTPTTARSQEAPENPWLEELEERLQEAKQHAQELERRRLQVRRRIELLSEIRRAAIQIGSLERQLELAEESGSDTADALEDQLRLAEIDVECKEERLDLFNRQAQLTELQAELRGAEQDDGVQEVATLLQQLAKVIGSIDKKQLALANEEEDQLERFEQQREAFERAADETVEIAELRLGIFWAEEEDEFEEAEELERELKERLQERAKPDRSEKTGPVKIDASFQPVELLEEDFVKVAKWNFADHVAPQLRTLCADCHSGSESRGSFNVDRLVSQSPLVVNREHWNNAIQQIKVRSMPPADAEPVPEAQRRELLAWLTAYFRDFDYESIGRPGNEPARRLTRQQYNNTIRDLLGVDVRPADRFPADMSATSGFRNSANSLFFQPITLERFVGAAEFAIDSALPVKSSTAEQQRAWQQLLQDDPALRSPESVIKRFSSRAFRRPVSEEQLRPLLNHYQTKLQQGQQPRQALRDVMKVILISPNFLFHSEQPADDGSLSQYELASRLSYFIWASMPDDELLSLAAQGTLSDPTTLRHQVDRMLNNSRATTLGTLFAAQWLGTDHLDRIRPDQIDNPWATDSLVAAMKSETAMLFSDLIANDQPIERLLDADFTFLNEELAKHYGMRDVKGADMRKVLLTGSSRRGLLGHGSVLAITSFPGRASPVVRGNWILSTLLGTPPPPPPPNVSEFDERIADRDNLSQREKLQLHRNNPNCYACHSQIDPLGFALSKFDWYGRYRPGRRNQDTRGTLPDGTVVDGLAGLSEAINETRLNDLNRQLTTKLLSYALGRQLEYYDEATIRSLVADLDQNERRIRSLVHLIVQTESFQKNDRQRERVADQAFAQ